MDLDEDELKATRESKIDEEETEKKIIELSIELAKKGIDIEQLIKDLQPMFDIVKEISDLSLKNYNYLNELIRK